MLIIRQVAALHNLRRQVLALLLQIRFYETQLSGPRKPPGFKPRVFRLWFVCHMDNRVAGCMGHELAAHAGSVLSQARPAPTFQLLVASRPRRGAAIALLFG
jgi:hypothetical protein